METSKVELTVGKDSKEIVDAIFELIKDIKEKKDVASIAAENLPGLMSAITGYENLDDEMKSEYRNETLAYAGYKLAEALAPEKVESAE